MTMRLSFITLGARDLPTLRKFYAGWGWIERPGASVTFAAFDTGGAVLAIYPLEMLRREAAPDTTLPELRWNGITLAMNVATAGDVNREIRRAIECGARAVSPPVRRDWGGYSGYIADPEGHRWEIAWAP